MQHGRKWLHKLLTPIVALALVLTGISFQGLAAMEAAETEEAGGLAAYGEAEGAEDLAACDQAEETEEPAAYAEVEETEKPAAYGGAEGKLERACEKAESGLEAMDAEEDDETEDDGEADETDKSALTEAIRRANQLKQAAYSAASWKKLKTALDAANKINDKEDASQEEADDAAENLEKAMKGLVKVPGKPGTVKAAWKGAKTVSLTWKKASDAKKYLVYRSYKSSSAGFKKIGRVENKTSYTDKTATPGKKAYYKVVAYNGGLKGGESAVKSVLILKAPASVKASASKTTVNVSFKKSTGASGYEIWSKAGKKGKYKKAATLKSAKTVKKKFTNQKDGTVYYKVRAYKQVGKKKYYTDYSKQVSVKVSRGSTIENTKSQLTIEADINLKGTGTGYHAKLVMVTPTSAVSFGIQYDQHAVAPYTGKAMALIENVANNDTGGQRYSRPGNKSLKVGQTYHMMMTVDKNGNGDVYLDYKKIGSFSQPNLAKDTCYLRIEASARLNGDSVDATFSNIKCKWNGKYDPTRVLGQNLKWNEFKTNAGLSYKYNQKKNNIRIFGTVQGINGDWDSAYDKVSDILQFQSNGAL